MDWQSIIEDIYAATLKEERWRLYLQGLGNTLYIAAVACLIGIFLGLLVAVVKVYAAGRKKPKPGEKGRAAYTVLAVLNGICNVYTTVIRGTPVVLQLLIIYSFQFISGGIVASIIGFGINSGAYVSEIFRAGINSVDNGQMEAGRSLGLSRNQTMKEIILPQAVKNILPSLFNEFIALVKETSIAGYIAVNDLTKLSNGIKGRTFTLYPLIVAAIFYLIITYGLTMVQKVLERRLARSDRS